MARTLHDLLAAFARHGGTPDGGVRRLAASAEDGAARDLLAAEIRRRGLGLAVDPIGNMFAMAGLVPSVREAVIVGSHLDSQPTGGRYDGTYGVLAGLLAVEAVAARAAAAPHAARRNLVLANWTNEEGARFQPSLTGSSVYAGTLPGPAAGDLVDGEGVRLAAALDAIGYRGEAPPSFEPARYVELHVEQGSRLEAGGIDIGVVTGAWAARKTSLVFHGEPSHTGPMPMERRRDALRAAARAIDLHYREIETSGTGAHASAARITVFPNSPNVTPSRVQVWFEFRHEDEAIACTLGDRFLAGAKSAVEPLGVGIEIAADERRGAAALDPHGAALALATARDLGFSAVSMKTVAGHDALALQRRVPSSLMFVPSRGGLSHNAAEFTDEAALDKGLAVLVELLWRMVTEAR
ncbi:allantoate amidohydrolase [Labrys monachus]|uniref:N-carbamoyl-L-amino-acid hydrolase n=1 Tax=Labrys monachus TaxID=217067 RepID=A0ABU0F9H4_9HYPH|nr:allantoate amidohydrolase [Labrys monachus]MDQ0391007.1 N-carbamoyl-L-amino-acid hydrolase [Labrys monachus]